VITVADLERGPKRVDFLIPPEWLKLALADSEASPTEQPGTFEVEVTKNGQEVLVRGRAKVDVVLPCARTLDPAAYPITSDMLLLLARASEATPVQIRSRKNRAADREPRRQMGKATGGKQGGWEADPVLSEQQAARDTYSGDEIVLDSFLREHIILELPMVPLREDLRSEPFEAIGAPPSGPDSEKPLDPRLQPLAELKARLGQKKE
jgi:uncharacterized metal-binding protein YceD (DUF177 family)